MTSAMTSPALTDETMALTAATAPLWREAVVGSSIAAMAAAAGLGVYAEAGAAPWLAIVAGTGAAVALWGLHRQLNRPAARPVRTSVSAPRLPTRAQTGAPGKAASVPSGALPATTARDMRLETRPELSAFTPRASAPTAPAAAIHPTRVVPPGPAASVPKGPSHLPPDDVIDAQFLHLQGLIKQLAAEVAGPMAATPDPDRAIGRSERAPLTTAPQAQAAQSQSIRAGSQLSISLAEAVAAERMDVLLEPIQSLADQKARHFEVSVRFRDAAGVVLPALGVAQVARSGGLSGAIDALKLPRVAKVARRIQSRGGAPADVLAAVTGASLADHAFMAALAAAFDKGATGAVVLSFAQADVRNFARIHWSALSAMADMGLRFALSDVIDLDMDFDLLRARSFVFAKLDAAVFLDGLPFSTGVIPAHDICRHIAQAGLNLVVDRIDDDHQLDRLRELGVTYGQGALFGGARPVRQDILG
jgi:EAL domain-containing protein (putative c-di-GMP-specific phosphodiesterase class I)